MSSTYKIKLILGAATAILTLIVYIPALNNDFVTYDDDSYSYDNPNIRSINYTFFKWAFFSFYSANWHPLTWLSHAMDYALWGNDPFGHHLTSLIVHSANTFLIFLIVIELINSFISNNAGAGAAFMSKKGVLIAAGITALLFGIHPIHVESAAWVSERKDVLCAFFFLLSLIAYLRYVSAADFKTTFHIFKSKWYLYSLVLFFLSLLSKPMAVSLPFVFLIMDWYPLGRFARQTDFRNLFLEKLPFFALSLSSAIITFAAQSSFKAVASLQAIPFSARILVGVKALFSYIWMMAFPFGLNAFYPYPHRVAVFSLDYLVIVFMAATAALFFIFEWKKHRLLSSLSGYYIVTLFPVLGFVQVGSQSMADRYTYLPGIGPAIFAGVLVALFFEKCKKMGRGLFSACSLLTVLAVICLLSYLTILQIRTWKNGVTLWSRVVQYEPDSAYAYDSRAGALAGLGLYHEAIKDCSTAIRLSRRPSALYHIHRARVFSKLDRYDEALNDLTLAIKYKQDYSTYLERAQVYAGMGYTDEALEDYNTAAKISPDPASVYFKRGAYHLSLGRAEDAFRDYSRAINSSRIPDYTYYNNRGIAAARLGRYEDAIRDYSYAIRLKPYFRDLYKNRGIAFRKNGRIDEAARDFELFEKLKGS